MCSNHGVSSYSSNIDCVSSAGPAKSILNGARTNSRFHTMVNLSSSIKENLPRTHTHFSRPISDFETNTGCQNWRSNNSYGDALGWIRSASVCSVRGEPTVKVPGISFARIIPLNYRPFCAPYLHRRGLIFRQDQSFGNYWKFNIVRQSRIEIITIIPRAVVVPRVVSVLSFIRLQTLGSNRNS